MITEEMRRLTVEGLHDALGQAVEYIRKARDDKSILESKNVASFLRRMGFYQ